MRLDLPEALPLVCPACRKHSERGLELFSLDVAEKARVVGDELVEGVLRCRGCARRYPVIDGIPVILKDLSQADAFGLLAAPASPEVLAALAGDGPDGAPLPHALEQLSSYLDASWGDRAQPPADFGFRALAAKLSGGAHVARSLELGCGVGRGLYELSRGSDLAVGVDRSGTFLRAARTLLRGEELRYGRRTAGRFYSLASARAPAAANVQLICADVLDPPFAPGAFGRVAALNLLDNVRSPKALLHHMSQLSAEELVLSSPYAWRDGIVEERLGEGDPASALRAEVAALGWRIDDEAELPWTLPRDARSALVYKVHYLRAHKGH